MDLGCIDLGCIDKHAPEDTTGHSLGADDQPLDASGEKPTSASKVGKNKSPRGNGQSSPFGALSRFTSQIKKPSYRKSSPINWFPRKKVDSYLKRKIQMLQETDGMNLTLDETLGDSSPHYSRVLREKIAAREAANKAMEARKAALVEASWCRILRAARIQSKEAETLLQKAEKTAAEAFEAASALGVIMYDTPNGTKKQCQIETSTADGGRSTTHTVTASFKTAFDVDKEVAAVVKTAFLRLATCSSIDKEELRDLLRKTSQNPDIDEISEFSSECESECSSEASVKNYAGTGAKLPIQAMRLKKFRRKLSPEKLTKTKLVDLMLERLKSLKEEELYSIASIVATCGLSAALAEVQSDKLHTSGSNTNFTSSHSLKARRMSSAGAGRVELPSLDKFLVKHVSRLEREVQEAKKAKRNDLREDNHEGTHNTDTNSDGRATSCSAVPDLGSILVKHSCKIEKEIEEAKRNAEKNFGNRSNKLNEEKKNSSDVIPDLGSILIIHRSKLEKEVQEAKENAANHEKAGRLGEEKQGGMHNGDANGVQDLGSILVKHSSKREKGIEEAKRNAEKNFGTRSNKMNKRKQNLSEDIPDLGSVLIIHRSKLEKEVQEAKQNAVNHEKAGRLREEKQEGIHDDDADSHCRTTSSNAVPDLGSILVKHSTKREKEFDEAKRTAEKNFGSRSYKPNRGKQNSWEDIPDLGSILIKHQSKLEKEVQEAKQHAVNNPDVDREGARRLLNGADSKKKGKVQEEVPGLETFLVKHVSRLEMEVQGARNNRTTEQLENENYVLDKENVDFNKDHDGRQQDEMRKRGGSSAAECEGLDKVLVKHVSRLEKEKMQMKLNGEETYNMKGSGRAARLHAEEALGGLDQVLVKHKSRLEKDKMAATGHEPVDQQVRPAVSSRRLARERELQAAWGGLSLGNSIRPHLSKLEKDKAAWIQAEEEERRRL